MTLLLVLLILLPWSIHRQMPEHEITKDGLAKMPILYAAIGVLGFGTGDTPTDGPAIGYLAVSVLMSIGFGMARGYSMPVWLDKDKWLTRGTKLTLILWGALVGTKIVMGTIGSITDIFPGEHVGDIFVFIAISFAAQNVILARRTFWHGEAPAQQPAAI